MSKSFKVIKYLWTTMLLLCIALIFSCGGSSGGGGTTGGNTAPATPIGLSISSATSSMLTITWNAASGATGYKLYRSNSSSGIYAQIGSNITGTTSYTDYGLTSSTTYYYTISAYNSYGESSSSSYVAGTTSSSTGNDWTIMFYADADNNLEEDIMADINEIESVDLSSKNINVIVLIDRASSTYTTDGDWTGDGNWTDTRAYKLGYDSTGFNYTLSSNSQRIAIPALGITTTGTTELNMGSQTTLESFISFCKSTYPADHYMLLVSNHGGGWRNKINNTVTKTGTTITLSKGITNKSEKTTSTDQPSMKSVCWDDTSSSDYLTMKEVHSAISNGMGSTKFDIIAFDACLMGMVEVAYELKDVATILVASAETIPGYGFPYTQIMTDLKNQSGSITANYFAQQIVTEYNSIYKNGGNVEGATYTDDYVTMAAIDLSKVSSLATAINSLATYVDADTNCLERFSVTQYEYKENIDLRHFCSLITNSTLSSKTTAYKTAATDVITAIDAAVLYKGAGSKYPYFGGLAIYCPSSPTNYAAYAPSLYTSTNINFASTSAASNWATLVNNGLTYDIGSDTDEPDDNSMDYAYYYLNYYKNTTYSKYISYTGDIDWCDMGWADEYYYGTGPETSTTVTVTLTQPTGVNYGLYIYGISSGTAYLVSHTTTTGNKTVTATGYTDYLIGINAVNGTDTNITTPYTLRASW